MTIPLVFPSSNDLNSFFVLIPFDCISCVCYFFEITVCCSLFLLLSIYFLILVYEIKYLLAKVNFL